MKNQTIVERKSERELVVTRTINGPPHLVFEAWTKPELFQRWWVPKSAPISLLSCDMDVRVGGKYRLVFGVDSQTMEFFGKYLDVTPCSRLAWTNDEDGDAATAITTVTFEDLRGKTLLTVHDLHPSKEALDAAIASGSSMDGMPEQLEQLDALMGDMSLNYGAVKRLYLMQVGIMPEYQIPIVCYLVQTDDGKNILIDSGLPEVMPEEAKDFENGQDVTLQLASLGLTPDDIDTVISTHYDIDHAGRHAAFTKAHYVVQRAHHLDAASNPRFAALRSQWDQPIERIRLVDGDTELLPGLALIETSGHVPGHQSVLVRLPKTGAILLTVDAVAFGAGFTRDAQDDGSNPDFEAMRTSTLKLLDLVEREQVGLVIFGHDQGQWKTLNKAPAFYE